ncbi:uncharacterized protein LOC144148203 [Haemaphysalis longicornis]
MSRTFSTKAEELAMKYGNRGIIPESLDGFFLRRSSPSEKEAIKGLRNNASIAILPADKGNAVVILNRSEYNQKLMDLLSDGDTYAAMKKDPTTRLQAKLQKLLSKIFQFVPPQQKHFYYRLPCTNGSAPAIYGLAKVHKPGVPLRPIVDFTRSPLHRLSGYLHQVLAPLAGKTATHIANSSAFVEKVRDIFLDEDGVLVSFDVKSLFTSVPVDLAVATCKEVLLADETLAERTPLEVEHVCELLEFCLSNTYFTYREQVYQQIHGTAMGASISVTTANLVMEVIEQKDLAGFDPKPKIFVRYVDDCFCIINRNDAPRLLLLLNSIEASIEFTAEYECDTGLPFLDVQLRRTGTSLFFWAMLVDIRKHLIPRGVMLSYTKEKWHRALNDPSADESPTANPSVSSPTADDSLQVN